MTGEIDKQNIMNQSSNNRAKIKLKDSFAADFFTNLFIVPQCLFFGKTYFFITILERLSQCYIFGKSEKFAIILINFIKHYMRTSHMVCFCSIIHKSL